MHDHKQLDTRRRSCVGTTVWLPSSFPLHLHRGRGGGEGLDLAWLPLSSPQWQRKPGRAWTWPGLCHSLCPHLFIPAVGMLPPASHGHLQHASISLLLPVKRVGEGCCVLSVPGQWHQEDSRDYKSRCPHGWKPLGPGTYCSPSHNQHRGMRNSFPMRVSSPSRFCLRPTAFCGSQLEPPRFVPWRKGKGPQGRAPGGNAPGLQAQDCQDGSSLNQNKQQQKHPCPAPAHGAI
jgi:hypothetical protein